MSSEGDPGAIRVAREGHLLLVTIDRPAKRNALTRAMGRALGEAWLELRDDPELRVAILTGAGDQAFCAGADLGELGEYYRSLTPFERRALGEHGPGLGGITRNLDPQKPIIAAINGPCLAGGLEIALACDLRIASERGSFGLPEVKRGIIPGAGGTQRLPRLIPLGLALEMLLTGEPVDAATALRHGLVNQVVDPPRLMEAARALAARIAAVAPLAVQTARVAALRGLHLSLEEGLRLEQFYAEPLRATEDAQEGLRAFAQKRSPVFRGR